MHLARVKCEENKFMRLGSSHQATESRGFSEIICSWSGVKSNIGSGRVAPDRGGVSPRSAPIIRTVGRLTDGSVVVETWAEGYMAGWMTDGPIAKASGADG